MSFKEPKGSRGNPLTEEIAMSFIPSISHPGYLGLQLIFKPFQLGFEPATGWGAYAASGKPIATGLMRNAIVKANGEQIVDSLNLASARGWAYAKGDLRLAEALSQLFQELFGMDKSQSYTAAVLITDMTETNAQVLLMDDLDAILPIASLYINRREEFMAAIDAGILL